MDAAAATTLLLSADAPLAAGRRRILPSRAARGAAQQTARGNRRSSSVCAYAAAAAPAPAAGVGVVSDYDLLALDSMAGCGLADKNTSMFPEVDSTWKTFREIQRLLSKTNGKVISDVMTPTPLVVRETTNLDAAARLLLETKYHRLPVVNSTGKLVGMITRGNVVRAALKIKKKAEEGA